MGGASSGMKLTNIIHKESHLLENIQEVEYFLSIFLFIKIFEFSFIIFKILFVIKIVIIFAIIFLSLFFYFLIGYTG